MFMRILPVGETMPPARPAFKSKNRDSPFKTQGAEDPFLTNPPGNSEQLAFGADKPTFENLDMEGNIVHHSVELRQDMDRPPSVSPTTLHAPTISRNPSDQPSDWLSPSQQTENGYSDLSGYTSPDFDNPLFLEPDMGYLESWANTQYQDPAALPGEAEPSQVQTVEQSTNAASPTTRQLLSPVPTSTPSPRAADSRLHPSASARESGLAHSPQSLMNGREPRRQATIPNLPKLETSLCDDTLNVNDSGHPDPSPSPIVKVSSYTRGDSPSRENELGRQVSVRKRSRNDHLSPAQDGASSDSDEDRDRENSSVSSGHRRTISVPVSSLRTDQGAWLANPYTGQRGLDPDSRESTEVLSPKEMMARQQLEEKNLEVAHWLSCSEANSEVEDHGASRFRSRVVRKLSGENRRRARSTGDPSIFGQGGYTPTLEFDDSAIPGPGALLEVPSERDDEEDEEYSTSSESIPESPPAQVDVNVDGDDAPRGYFAHVERTDSAPDEQQEPLPRQFVRAGPWQDQLRNPWVRDTEEQPETSNAAMMRFRRRAENIETASRVATIGTRDMSEADVQSIIGPDGRFSSLRIGKDELKSRRDSILERATRFLPKRSSSSAKRKSTQLMQQQPNAETFQRPNSNDTAEGNTSPSGMSRQRNSISRPTHPSASSAGPTMPDQIAAATQVGKGAGATASPVSNSSPLSHFRNRSKSEIPKDGGPRATRGLRDLMTSVGGPPMPVLASPVPDRSPSERVANGDDEEDDDIDDDEIMDDKGVVMEFPVDADLIVPSLDGFRNHVRQLNPRLQPALVERVAQEQTRRYKKLVDLKIKHAHAVSKGRCTAGQHCVDQGGAAQHLPPRPSPKDPGSTYGQFEVDGTGAATDGLDGFSEGAVMAAHFPSGVPLPPAKRLPAEFECSLCFKVKKFQKPSDWTKHVHEDLQPFTCSFPECTEPKSFKRKADWVRHESERHRHLEWWKCNMADCPHTCYRKDNFVQHLVREHKMQDPKAKAPKGRSNRNVYAGLDVDGNLEAANHEQGLEELWRSVDECRHVSSKQPRDEACRFCGNVCLSWKKLTVHMAKHMEQIAMPVLELVKQVKVSEDAIEDGGNVGLRQQQQPNTHLTTPVTAYPGSNSSRSPASSRVSPKPASQTPMYGTGGLLTAAFGVPQTTGTPLSSRQLRTQNALSGMPHSGNRLSAPTPNYAASAYSQASSPSLGGEQLYRHPSQEQKYPVAANNSATYPPPFNDLPRDQGARDTAPLAQTPMTTLPYNLDINAAVQTGGGFDNRHLYTSPENGGYIYQSGDLNSGGQQFSVPYHPASNNIDGFMAQGDDYIHHGHVQY